MKTRFSEIPSNIQNHLKRLVESSNLPDTPDLLDRLSANWLHKETMFLSQINLLGMTEIQTFEKENPNGLLGITYSGSIIMLGPTLEGSRNLRYGSIKLRQDVPEIIETEHVLLAAGTGKDQTVELEGAPVKQTSALFKVATCPATVALDEQAIRLSEAFTYLTNGFVDINNKTLILENVQHTESYTLNSMSKIVAEKQGLSIKQTRQILKDFLEEIEKGIVSGKRVSLGNIGNFSSRTKPPQKARLGRNPATGTEILIRSKPETKVPHISFSSALKAKVNR